MNAGALRIRRAAEGDLDALAAFAPDDPVGFVTAAVFAEERAGGRYETRSSRGFGRSSRPRFATWWPSCRTTSAVKSFSPRIRAEPTP